MIELRLDTFLTEQTHQDKDVNIPSIPVSLHSSLYPIYQKLKLWQERFFVSYDEAILNDLLLVQLLAKKRYLDHRPPSHLFRLVLSIYHMQRKLMHLTMLNSHIRHVAVRWIPTNLIFPFSSKPVVGCLIGFNTLDRCELFDEENVVVALQKHFPNLELVHESYYRHASQHENLKVFYFEVKKKNGASFSLSEQKILKANIEEKIKNSIQQLSPSVFMNLNMEEIYKNLLILSQEIQEIHDLPQVYITLDQNSGKEVIFNVILVQISPFHRFSLKERLFGCRVISERMVPVRNLEDRPIDAYILRLSLPRNLALLRSDGSLDFYAARQKVVALLTTAVGEFRDYNGGLLVKQQELLFSFKNSLIEQKFETELIETFFYALVPIEKQALLDPKILSMLFIYFSEERKEKVIDHFSLKIYCDEEHTFFIVHSMNSSINSLVTSVFEDKASKMKDLTYNFVETTEGFFFNGVLLQQNADQAKSFVESLQETLERWRDKKKSQQVLRIAFEQSPLSLDPRIGGEGCTNNVLRILFEGLTRFNPEGHVENGVAESIEVSPDLKEYTFHLRTCLWNNGSLVSAHDFAYAWKKVLSPDFKTNFANLFYPIKNAKEVKEGKVSVDEVGIHAIDDRTLRVELMHPTPYFLQLLAYPLFSPIHRSIDQDSPQWPYQAEKSYPCNGPFQIKINQPNQGYHFVKNPLYWDAGHISLDQIILTKMDPLQATQAFQKNEIDWLGAPFTPWHSIYDVEEQTAQLVSQPNATVGWCVFNTASFPFNHTKIRQAFALAIDRAELIQEASLPLTPAYSILTSETQGQQGFDFPEINVAAAKKLFEEGLKELNLSKENFVVSLIFPEFNTQRHIAQRLKQQIEKNLEIQCDLHSLSWKLAFQKFTEGRFQIGLVHWISWLDDPIYTLNIFKFATEGVNFAKWEDPQFRELLDLSQEALNPFQRSSYLRQATEILSKEVPVFPLYNQPFQALIRKELSINTKLNFISHNIARTYYNKGV